MDRAAFVQLGASVLQIEALHAQGSYSLGSGVVVAAERVITNCHVTRGASELHVVRGGFRWRVVAQASDAEHDLCLLNTPGIGAEPVNLAASSDLRLGQAVTALGYTGGIGIQSSAGEVVALHRLDNGNVIQSTNWFTSGASGGGLFDEQQRLVGILTFRLRGGASHYFAAPIEWVHRLMADRQAFREVKPAPPTTLAYWEQPPETQPAFLRAAVLERDHKWSELELLAQQWATQNAGDPLPWYMSGLALTELDRLPEAKAALERCVSVEPAFSVGWYQLGRVWARLGQLDRAREALARLIPLSADMAADLSKLINGT